jgi:hypothetical protein
MIPRRFKATSVRIRMNNPLPILPFYLYQLVCNNPWITCVSTSIKQNFPGFFPSKINKKNQSHTHKKSYTLSFRNIHQLVKTSDGINIYFCSPPYFCIPFDITVLPRSGKMEEPIECDRSIKQNKTIRSRL